MGGMKENNSKVNEKLLLPTVCLKFNLYLTRF